MENATNPMLPAVPAPTRHSSKLEDGPTLKWAAALTARFSLLWPKAWADSTAGLNHDMINAEWARGIADLTGEEISQGLEHCRRHVTWPPSIAEFRTACRGGANAEQRAYAARVKVDQDVKALRHGTWGDTAENVAAHVQQARKALGSRRVTRCLTDAAAGRWTREMETAFMANVHALGLRFSTIDWEDLKCDH